ncbi:MAG: RHS repeat-associated core domain-containing protein [Verrucomicrobia bacterium]|nr:RHS repeat-associated core domain-containing protein [Verrucomicrobiota bacterium]
MARKSQSTVATLAGIALLAMLSASQASIPRLRTVYTPVDGGVACPKLSVTQESWYDPEVEFLEIGVSVNGQKHWKMVGPDLNGVYGGLQGIGGLEAIIKQSDGTVTPLINDAFGNVVASVTNSTSVVWNSTRVGGYGPLPGSSAQWLSTNTTLATATVWRSKRMDPTGYVNMGARYYDPVGGRFLSPDPLGHEASMDLYSYANGDPINECDPDGRFGKNATSSRLDDPFSQGMIQSYNQEREAQINQEVQWKDSDIQWKEPEGPNYYVSPAERAMSVFFHAVPGTMQLLSAMESVSGQNPLTLEPVDRREAALGMMLSMTPLGGVGGGVGRGGVSALSRSAARMEMGALARAPVVAARREVVVVGEGVKRVNEMARRLRVEGFGVRTYTAPNMKREVNPNAYGSPKSLDANWHWIDYWARKKQVDVIDIGLQPGRSSPSPYYRIESRNLLRWEESGQIQPVIRIDPGF